MTVRPSSSRSDDDNTLDGRSLDRPLLPGLIGTGRVAAPEPRDSPPEHDGHRVSDQHVHRGGIHIQLVRQV